MKFNITKFQNYFFGHLWIATKLTEIGYAQLKSEWKGQSIRSNQTCHKLVFYVGFCLESLIICSGILL